MGFSWKKTVVLPERSVKLAEFVGIMIGDGHVGKYQFSITLNLTTDLEYLYYVKALVEELFGITVKRQIRKDRGCSVLVVSSVDIVSFLVELGLPQGNKMEACIDIPEWVKNDPAYSKACLRGIFDTDGSVFQEKHTYKDKIYAYVRMYYVSGSAPLRMSIVNSLSLAGIKSDLRNNRDVSIGRFTDVAQYFKIVGSSNFKHIMRYEQFGGVG